MNIDSPDKGPANIDLTASAMRASLDYTRSRIQQSQISQNSKGSSIVFLPEKWSSVISVAQVEPLPEDQKADLPELSKEVESRIHELGIAVRDSGISRCSKVQDSSASLLKSRVHRFEKTQSVYQGQVQSKGSEEIPHGEGSLYLANGSFFSGRFVDGFANGIGRLIMRDGSYYQGTFYNNLISGKGKYVQGTTVYEGQFKDGMLHGKGTLSCPEAVFTGTFVDGHKTEGILIWGQKKECMYMGGFQDDLFHGKGIVKSSMGHFDGQFVKGNREGYGVHSLPDGNRYEGNFSNDMKNGYGQCFDRHGKAKYRGYWQNDYPIQQLKKAELKPASVRFIKK